MLPGTGLIIHSPMRKFPPHYAFIALAFWLLANWGGAYAHLCFDGKEPPVSVHMEMMGGHLDHHDGEPHQDADVNLLQSVVAKLSKIDLGLVLVALVVLALSATSQRPLLRPYVLLLPSVFPHSRPLLRAPPFTA